MRYAHGRLKSTISIFTILVHLGCTYRSISRNRATISRCPGLRRSWCTDRIYWNVIVKRLVRAYRSSFFFLYIFWKTIKSTVAWYVFIKDTKLFEKLILTFRVYYILPFFPSYFFCFLFLFFFISFSHFWRKKRNAVIEYGYLLKVVDPLQHLHIFVGAKVHVVATRVPWIKRMITNHS